MATWIDKTFYGVDFNIAKLFHILETHTGNFMIKIMEFISLLGKLGIFMIVVSAILCIFPKTRKMGVTSMFALGISFIIATFIIKPLVARARPYDSNDINLIAWWTNAGKHLEDSYSFPSGHSTASMAFAISLFMRSKHKKITWLVLFFPILMASSRIFLMVHYFSDCIFGFVVGIVGAVIGYLITYLLFDKTKGKFHDFVNNFKVQDLFKSKKDKN